MFLLISCYPDVGGSALAYLTQYLKQTWSSKEAPGVWPAASLVSLHVPQGVRSKERRAPIPVALDPWAGSTDAGISSGVPGLGSS